jgi:putative spermidine/putrescine transport system substrate-binding protein
VPLDKLYPLDVDRAFKKLDQIKPHIKVWWTQGNQSEQLLRDGEVDMIAAWNARPQALIDQGQPVEIVWSGAEHVMGYWGVVKGTPRSKLAWRFVDFYARAEPQAEFSKQFLYGPSNPDAFKYLPQDLARKLPTFPDYKKVGFRHDTTWLVPRLSALSERWTQWLAT